ncbi:uncharacterized protein LDX57_012601 [Aspergillus melleus]|uniref:uncharacterized protein n=1 Tax=Aspergillus melleus TaxID=138277 RepID=UPI001E8E4DF0|nr:uncharacterized protein LDX57_012601 [Aspergillus melleus]KAH8434969.1 hypothetical protein LDX57_012601 [Aspergillus melleus]
MEKKPTADSRPSADLSQDPYQETIPSKETTNDMDTNFHSLSPPTNSPLDIEQKDEEADIPPISEAEQKQPVVVPRLKRRGLFGQLTLLAEIENPKTYPRKKKWFITFIVAVAGATAPMGSSIFFRKLTSLICRGDILYFFLFNRKCIYPLLQHLPG